jgi:hypothetical protein
MVTSRDTVESEAHPAEPAGLEAQPQQVRQDRDVTLVVLHPPQREHLHPQRMRQMHPRAELSQGVGSPIGG